MERRRVDRKVVDFSVELISGGKSYIGYAGNISEYGAYVKIAPAETAIDFLPETLLEMNFKIPSGEKLNLNCEIMWLYAKRISSRVLENHIGLEIKNSPPEYENFFKSL